MASVQVSRSRDAAFEEKVLEFIWNFHARRLRDIAVELGMPSPPDRVAKQFGFQVAARIVDSGPPSISVLDFEKRGIAFKTVRVSPDRDALPYESTSFPAFEHTDLAQEEWETSTLRGQLSRVFFVTLVGRERSTPLPQCTFGDGFFWTPTESDWMRIREDWTDYRAKIRAGRAHDLPKESETRAIHVRPHGRNSRDLDEAPGTTAVPKKSFWLNKAFVQELIAQAVSS